MSWTLSDPIPKWDLAIFFFHKRDSKWYQFMRFLIEAKGKQLQIPAGSLRTEAIVTPGGRTAQETHLCPLYAHRSDSGSRVNSANPCWVPDWVPAWVRHQGCDREQTWALGNRALEAWHGPHSQPNGRPSDGAAGTHYSCRSHGRLPRKCAIWGDSWMF